MRNATIACSAAGTSVLGSLLLSGLLLAVAGCQSSSVRTMPRANHLAPASQPAPTVSKPKPDIVKPPKSSKPAVRTPAPAAPPQSSTVKYTVQPIGADANTRIELIPQPDQLIVDIRSKGGKGAVSLQLLSGTLPRRVVLRLHQQKLFSLRVWAASFLIYDLNTTTSNETQQVLVFGQATYIQPDHACWVNVNQGEVNGETVYQAVLPPMLIGQPNKNDKIGLAWTGYDEPPAVPPAAVVKPAPAIPPAK